MQMGGIFSVILRLGRSAGYRRGRAGGGSLALLRETKKKKTNSGYSKLVKVMQPGVVGAAARLGGYKQISIHPDSVDRLNKWRLRVSCAIIRSTKAASLEPPPNTQVVTKDSFLLFAPLPQ